MAGAALRPGAASMANGMLRSIQRAKVGRTGASKATTTCHVLYGSWGGAMK